MRNFMTSVWKSNTHSLIPGTVEEENSSPQNAIDERHSSVQARVLFIRGQGAHGEAGEDERHDDQI